MKQIEQVQILAAQIGNLGFFLDEAELWQELLRANLPKVQIRYHFDDLAKSGGGLIILAGYFQAYENKLFFALDEDDFVQGYPKDVQEISKGADLLMMMGSFVESEEFWQAPDIDLFYHITESHHGQKSPIRPGVSQLGLFFREALEGEPEALVEGHLSAKSLFDFLQIQLPQLQGKVQNELELIDFTGPLLPKTFGEFPLDAIRLIHERPMRTKDVLTRLKNWHNLNSQQIEFAVNRDLTDYLGSDLAELTAELKRKFRFSIREMGFSERILSFPEGSITYEFKIHNKKTGILVETLELLEPWLFRAESLEKFIEVLAIYPDRVEFCLKHLIEPTRLSTLFNSKDYKLLAQKQDAITVQKGPVKAEIHPDKIVFMDEFAHKIFMPGNSEKAMDLLVKIFGLKS